MDLAELAHAQWREGEERETQQNVLVARDYYEGDFDLPLTDRQLQFIGYKRDDPFGANFCRVVVNAVSERMIVKGFDSPDKTLSAWANELWQGNRMDAHSMVVHLNTLRDAEYFVIVSIDDQKQLTFTPHERYTDPTVEGTGYGCRAIYPDDDTSQPMLYAIKRWTETVEDDNGKPATRQRMTVYFPERIERYVMGKAGEWAPYEEDGQPFPTPWLDRQGQPLGIPVIHFRNAGDRSELWDAIPLQDAINKMMLDVIAAQDSAGFPILIARGFYLTSDGLPPASDGSNLLKLAPGSWLGTPEAAMGVDRMQAAEMAPMLAVIDSFIVKLAQVTDTPISRFQLTGQVASSDTLKQQDAALLGKIRARQTVIGDAWEDCLYMARQLANTFAGAGLDESAIIETLWEPAESRDDTVVLEQLAIKREKLNIPLRQIWKEAGYTEEQIVEMLKDPEVRNLSFATYPGAANA